MEQRITAATERTVHVIATTFEGTRAALTTAVPLARGSHARLMVLVVQRASPPGRVRRAGNSNESLMRRYRDLLSECGADAQLRLCVCRRTDDVVTRLLPPGATVVVGGPSGGFLPSPEARLIRRMSRLGHHAVFVPVVGTDAAESLVVTTCSPLAPRNSS